MSVALQAVLTPAASRDGSSDTRRWRAQARTEGLRGEIMGSRGA